MNNETIWVEKYRPTKIKDLILDDETKAKFQRMIDEKDIPHLMFHGGAGTGKTTLAKILCNQVGVDYLFVNASLDANIDLLRDKISHFARTVSIIEDKKKVVILDEVDGVTGGKFFDALRPMIEQYSNNCVFIFTLNYIEKIPDPIKSRCQVFNFSITDKKSHANKVMKRLIEILDNEKVDYDKAILADIILVNFPDIRKMINTCQQHRDSLKDEKLKYKLFGGDIEPLIKAMKEKDFNKIKEYVVKDLTYTEGIYRSIYERLKDFIDPKSIPPAILLLDEYQQNHVFVIDKEIHCIAFLLSFTNTVTFK